MTHDEFEELLDRRLDSVREILEVKSSEYSSSKDKLHNFYTAARLGLDGVTAPEALYNMLLKHMVSVRDMVQNYKDRRIIPSKTIIDEKIKDVIAYHILLEAIFEDLRKFKSSEFEQIE